MVQSEVRPVVFTPDVLAPSGATRGAAKTRRNVARAEMVLVLNRKARALSMAWVVAPRLARAQVLACMTVLPPVLPVWVKTYRPTGRTNLH